MAYIRGPHRIECHYCGKDITRSINHMDGCPGKRPERTRVWPAQINGVCERHPTTTGIAGLVAELRLINDGFPGSSMRRISDLCQRAADALENMPRTVIASLREPTEAMMQAGCASNPPGKYHADTKLSEIILAEWQAMIDEALKEQ